MSASRYVAQLVRLEAERHLEGLTQQFEQSDRLYESASWNRRVVTMSSFSAHQGVQRVERNASEKAPAISQYPTQHKYFRGIPTVGVLERRR